MTIFHFHSENHIDFSIFEGGRSALVENGDFHYDKITTELTQSVYRVVLNKFESKEKLADFTGLGMGHLNEFFYAETVNR